ncbi:hypothetical protein BIW11_07536 [Tropilaelaps mercedesae]|uniref:Uncharacterized protein n=1 Tax=Tropilaelaps mercedesae TaxID=418985 RepID=A0A1V9XTW5_9ACAR|nr:hypothetical protein BIW11_07536 [Tropilaelaps mercedesae]
MATAARSSIFVGPLKKAVHAPMHLHCRSRRTDMVTLAWCGRQLFDGVMSPGLISPTSRSPASGPVNRPALIVRVRRLRARRARLQRRGQQHSQQDISISSCASSPTAVPLTPSSRFGPVPARNRKRNTDLVLNVLSNGSSKAVDSRRKNPFPARLSSMC